MKSMDKLRETIERDVGNLWSDLKGGLLVLVDRVEAEINESYMPLPLDADGIPIRVGDLIEFGEKGERLEVTHFGWTKHGDPTIAYRRPNGTLDCSCIGDGCRHVKPRTVEDVLRECASRANDVYNNPRIDGDTRGDELDILFDEYATEIRELMDGDA